MPGLGIPSMAFAAFVFAFLPWASVVSARQILAEFPEEGLPTSKASIFAGTVVVAIVNLVLAALVADSVGMAFFAWRPLGGSDVVAALAALLACLGLQQLLRRSRSEAERRRLIVFRLAPRTRAERWWWIALVPLVSISEEATYRGAGMAILWHVLGDPWSAAALCAAAFALAHSLQGWKSCLMVFAVGLVLQALVAATGTLVLAMGVHAVVDYLAGAEIIRLARRYDAEAPPAAGETPVP